jgi:hypothetical protein
MYGAAAAGWTLTLDDLSYGNAVTVCAIATELLEALRGPEPPSEAVLVDLGEASLGAAGPGVSPPGRLP